MVPFLLFVSDWSDLHIFLSLECNTGNTFYASGWLFIESLKTYPLKYMQGKTQMYKNPSYRHSRSSCVRALLLSANKLRIKVSYIIQLCALLQTEAHFRSHYIAMVTNTLALLLYRTANITLYNSENCVGNSLNVTMCDVLLFLNSGTNIK
jgi:hypothetical protein